MSGFCALVTRDGAVVAQEHIAPMTKALQLRGPDGTRLWSDEHASLVYSWFAVGKPLAIPELPYGHNGRWITGHVRLDGRNELISSLAAAGHVVTSTLSDEALVLHAYTVWGARCLERLIGDFAFVIWDGNTREMFCARDQLGVRPLFYSVSSGQIVASNAIESILVHPTVPKQLDDLAIADFLLFDASQDPSSSYFAAVRRLPPAHALKWRDGVLNTWRYWEADTASPVVYRRQGEYLERFEYLLRQAVRDRVRDVPRVAMQFSGGLDSTSVAAIANQLRQQDQFELRAHSITYDSLIPDDERRFIQSAAAHLGIQVDYIEGDDYRLFEPRPRLAPAPEPFHSPDHALIQDAAAAAKRFAPVVLTGWDGDMLVSESPRPYLRDLWRSSEYIRFASVLAGYAWLHKRFIPLSWTNRALGRIPSRPQYEFPQWISPDLERRYALRARWAALNAPVDAEHRLRPAFFRTLRRIQGQSSFFAAFDPTVTGHRLEYRHPFFDLRLLDFCLGAPPWPWCDQKHVLRQAMRTHLPLAILGRPKTPLQGYPYVERVRRGLCSLPPVEDADERIYAYVSRGKINSGWVGQIDPLVTWADLRIASLDQWFKTTNAQPGKP